MARLLLLLGLLGCSTHGAYLRPTPRQQVQATVVLIESGYVSCAGVRLEDGILTAAHCMCPEWPVCDEPMSSVEVKSGGAFEAADLVRIDVQVDLALLTDPFPEQGGAIVGWRFPELGAPITIVGHPSQHQYVMRWGRVSSDVRTSRGFAVVTGGLAPGFSGGPVFDESGAVVGIVSRFAFTAGRIVVPDWQFGECATAEQIRAFLGE